MENKVEENTIINAVGLIGVSIIEMDKMYSVPIYQVRNISIKDDIYKFEGNIIICNTLFYCQFDKEGICTLSTLLGKIDVDTFRIEDYENEICIDISKRKIK